MKFFGKIAVTAIVLCMTGLGCQVKEQPNAESKRANFGGDNNDDARMQMQFNRQKCMTQICSDLKIGSKELIMEEITDFWIYGYAAGEVLNQLDDSNKRAQRAARGVSMGYYQYRQYTDPQELPSYLLVAIEDDACYCLQSSKVDVKCTERVIESENSPGKYGKHGHLRFELRNANNITEVKDKIEFDTDTNMIVISRHNDSCNVLEFRTHSGDTGAANIDSSGAVLEQKVKLNMSAEAGKRFSSLD